MVGIRNNVLLICRLGLQAHLERDEPVLANVEQALEYDKIRELLKKYTASQLGDGAR